MLRLKEALWRLVLVESLAYRIRITKHQRF
jgi:hypothetical protein